MKLFSRDDSRTPQQRRSPAKSGERGDESIGLRQDYAFRRGRTLTGSASVHVRTTNELQADLKSPRVHAHILARKRRHLGGLFVLAIVGTLSLLMLLTQFSADIVLRPTPDSSLQLDEAYVGLVKSYMSDHPAEFWRFMLDEGRLTEYVSGLAPEIKSLRKSGTAGIGSSRLEVELREPIASWDINGRQIFVDKDGIPFTHNYFPAPALTVSDRSGIPLVPGQTVASNRFMGFVGQVIGQTEAHGYEVASITIPPDMTRQIEVRLTGVGYPIKLSSDRKVGEGVEDMVRAVSWMKERNVTPEYIDVRVKGRAFYR